MVIFACYHIRGLMVKLHVMSVLHWGELHLSSGRFQNLSAPTGQETGWRTGGLDVMRNGTISAAAQPVLTTLTIYLLRLNHWENFLFQITSFWTKKLSTLILLCESCNPFWTPVSSFRFFQPIIKSNLYGPFGRKGGKVDNQYLRIVMCRQTEPLTCA